jgi:cell division septation protein DedD
VILVSDLVDASPDQAPLENIAARYQREGVDLRVLAVPTEASARGQTPNAFTAPNVTFIERGASHTFVPAAVQPPTRHTGLLVALVALVGILLAVYELALHPLSWSVRA